MLKLVLGGLALLGVIAGYEYYKAHKVQPGNLGAGPGMYGLDQGIPPELAQMTYVANMQETNPATLRKIASDLLATTPPYPIAAHVLNQRADTLTAKQAA
jgi:hypothetical protein